MPVCNDLTPAAATRSARIESSVTAEPLLSGSRSLAAIPAGVDKTGSPPPTRVNESDDAPETPTTFVVNVYSGPSRSTTPAAETSFIALAGRSEL